jgi:hypothetical protein
LDNKRDKNRITENEIVRRNIKRDIIIMKATISFVLLATFVGIIAGYFGIITTRQILIINIIGIIIVSIVIVFTLYKIFKMTKAGYVIYSLGATVTIPKARIDNKFLSANSDLLKMDIVPTNPSRISVFRMAMEINNSIEQLGMSAVRSIDSNIIENTIQKSFVAKETYIIDTLVGPNETINFKFDNDINIIRLMIDELYVP